MKKLISLTTLISVISINLISAGNTLALTPNFLVSADLHSAACSGLAEINSSQGCGTGSGSVNTLVGDIVTIISYVIGALSVVMIIISGARFITSGGDSQKVSSAKSALIYALIGLAVVALTQVLIHFVFNTTAKL